MGSRMDRYRSISDTGITRSSKNEDLYTSLDNNARYTTITDVRNSNAVELKSRKVNTRESYQRTKDYAGFVEYRPVRKELDDFNYLYQERGNRVYDINTAIEEAKRKVPSKDENKKKASFEDYFLTQEEIEKYKKIKNKEIVPDKDSVKELINTITSKTLKGEIDQATSVNLLSDLMATDKEDAIESQKSKTSIDLIDKDFLEKVQENKDSYQPETPEKSILKDMDQSFYTRSMDLSDKDFDIDTSFEEEKKVPTIFKILLVILLISLVGVLIYFVVQSF